MTTVKTTDCGKCDGAGAIEDDCGSAVECERCWGHGVVPICGLCGGDLDDDGECQREECRRPA